MTWQLRRADAGDLDGIMALESSIFGTDAWSSDTMRGELESEHCWYLVAFRPETPAHFDAYAGLLAPQGAREADIQTIAVSPEQRRSGLGRLLMRTLINEAGKRGAQEVFLEVRADNTAAQELYRSLGFEQIAVRPRYYQPDNVDALVLRMTVPERSAGLAGES
ncbi:MAG: ribosomal protein S18-alanine N-acetyltransferase [Cryobacterium sp.]|jgi:ribosomal-protein-alanine acetyltransferase|nr:ribosomal protein S18-alanine N-acetyltransferase [Cryobacterium sp.]